MKISFNQLAVKGAPTSLVKDYFTKGWLVYVEQAKIRTSFYNLRVSYVPHAYLAGWITCKQFIESE